LEKLKILSFKNQREILEFLFNGQNSNPLFTEDEKFQKIRNLIDYTDPSEKEFTENSYKLFNEKIKHKKEEINNLLKEEPHSDHIRLERLTVSEI
jgi:hypothetical protein